MHLIKITIADESVIYNSFLPAEDVLSEDVKSYILGRLEIRELQDDITLQLCSESPLDEERFSHAIDQWAEEEQTKIKGEFKKNMLQQLWMFGVGVVFIALSIVLEPKVSTVLFTVISTIGAFSMWEAASIWIVKNPMLRRKKRIIDRLKNHLTITVNK